MKAISVIGWQKARRFIWTSVYAALLHRCLLPQVRVWLLRLAGAKVGRDTVIFDAHFANLYHYGFTKLRIGDRCFVGDEVWLDTRGGLTLENEVTVSDRAAIITHINVGYPDHPLQKYYPTREARVVLRKGCYLGTAALILPGVTVGELAVVGAGAVVTRDVAGGAVVAGVPARIIKRIYKFTNKQTNK